MSDERTGPADPAFIGRALQGLTADLAAMRDEMRVQTAMILRQDAAMGRQDATLNAVLERLRAMVAQHQRTVDRVRAPEDKIEGAPFRWKRQCQTALSSSTRTRPRPLPARSTMR